MRLPLFRTADVASTSPRYELGKVAFSSMFLKPALKITKKITNNVKITLSASKEFYRFVPDLKIFSGEK